MGKSNRQEASLLLDNTMTIPKLTDECLTEVAFGRYKGLPESWLKSMAQELLTLRSSGQTR